MKIAIDGNVKVADEIISQIELWDAAVLGNKIDHLLDQCADDVSMFDVSIQLDGIDAYKKEWEKFSPYFSENVQIGIKLDVKENYLYVATLHTITDGKLRHGINNGRLKKFDK